MNTMQAIKFDREVDATGLDCPMPLLKAKQALNALDSGQIVYVQATDAGSVRDFDAFCRQSGHRLLATEANDDTYHYWIEKK
jgi:TusA-related sulfurtransferase